MLVEDLLSERAREMKASEIRELLKLVTTKDVISFAGGLPDPSTFPVEGIIRVSQAVLKEKGRYAMQYGTTEGVLELRELLAERVSRMSGVEVGPENVLITVGSQQGLDLLGKVFIDPGDPVIVEAPTYLGAVAAFRTYAPDFLTVKMDDEGAKVNLIEDHLERLKKEGKKPKFIYVVPTFQNPAGVTMSDSRREHLVKLAREYDVLVIEDTPYEELRYAGDEIRSIFSRAPERVISLGTFSKILAPGFRIAWMVGPENFIRRMVIAKQAADLCAPPFTQYVLAEYLKQGDLDAHIKEIRKIYAEKRRLMLDALDEHMPEHVQWTKPEGGMFLWVRAPEYVDTKEMFPRAVEKKVAYVVGTAFYVHGEGKNEMRLNFSYPEKEQIHIGIQRLAEVLREEMKRSK